MLQCQAYCPFIKNSEETLMAVNTMGIPPGPDITWFTAGGSGGHRGAGPTDDGDDESEELSTPVPPCLSHAGPSPSRCCSVTGQLSFCKLTEVSRKY